MPQLLVPNVELDSISSITLVLKPALLDTKPLPLNVSFADLVLTLKENPVKNVLLSVMSVLVLTHLNAALALMDLSLSK